MLSKDNVEELDDGRSIIDHVKTKQEKLNEKQKAKRAQSVVNSDVLGTKDTSFNVGKVDVSKMDDSPKLKPNLCPFSPISARDWMR